MIISYVQISNQCVIQLMYVKTNAIFSEFILLMYSWYANVVLIPTVGPSAWNSALVGISFGYFYLPGEAKNNDQEHRL